MINSSKKNTVGVGKNTSNHSKGLKRSKSTQFVLPKKTVKRAERVVSTEGKYIQVEKHGLSKSKSTKSLKSKGKHVSLVGDNSIKKRKQKKSSSKTIKKAGNKQLNQFSSLLSQDWEIKKPTSEYFIYHNNYIPIENSAQRRFVYKIQMIDLENKSTASTFYPIKEEKGIETNVIQLRDTSVGEQIVLGNKQVQTEKSRFEEAPGKCFLDVLTELEFLYLPNEDNFAPFTNNQRIHYGQLLESLAKKMLGQSKVAAVDEFLTVQQVTVLLYQREGIQVGALDFVPFEGFPTHLLSIILYLKNIFCFLEHGFKEEVLAMLHQHYGLNYNERVNRLSRGLPHTKDHRGVLSSDIFESFEEEMFKEYNFNSEIVEEAVHTHNRAIFDAVNDQLQAFRPFFSSQGEPFPWTSNIGMTHYDITEQALYIIFIQIKQKIQKYAMTLCGMFTDFDDDQLPNPSSSPFYLQKMQQRQQKMIREEVKDIDDKVELDYENSNLIFQLANEVLSELVKEMKIEMEVMDRKEVQGDEVEDFEFQYFN